MVSAADTGMCHIPEPDRVRANTHPEINARVDRHTRERIEDAAAGNIDDRLAELDGEWDVERVIEAEAATTGLVGLVLGLAVDRRFLFIPAVAAAMVLLHATQGWYPLLPILRRSGIRTREEIDQERYALKALRGDFREVRNVSGDARAEAAWQAVHL